MFIPTSPLLLEFTFKVLKFQYIIICRFEGNDYIEKSCLPYNIWALRVDCLKIPRSTYNSFS